MEDLSQKDVPRMTEEQIAEQEAKMIDWYNKRIPFLEVKHRHDTLVAEIDQANFTSHMARASLQKAMAEEALSKREFDMKGPKTETGPVEDPSKKPN
jgi:hypothetical protein